MINKELLKKLSNIPSYEFRTLDVVSPMNVKELRVKIGVSQRSFARILGISNKTVEKWESGKNPVTGTAAKLLYILNLHPELINLIYEFKITTVNESRKSLSTNTVSDFSRVLAKINHDVTKEITINVITSPNRIMNSEIMLHEYESSIKDMQYDDLEISKYSSSCPA